MKFYEVQEQWNNLHWHTVAYFKRRQDAQHCIELYEEKSTHYPIRIEERNLSKISENKESLLP